MSPNPGHLPEEAKGKRVRVRLVNGLEPRDDPALPPGWAADGRGGCSWERTGHPFDVDAFEVIG